MKHLFHLDPAEVSLVPKGANMKKFLILKEGQMGKQLVEQLKNLDPAVLSKVEQVLKSHKITKEASPEQAAPEAEGNGVSERASAALKAVVRILTPFKEELSPHLLHDVLEAAGLSLEAQTEEEEQGESMSKEGDGMVKPKGVEDAHHEEAAAVAHKAAEAAYKSHIAKLGYRKYPEEQPQLGGDKHPVAGDAAHSELLGKEAEGEEYKKMVSKEGKVDMSALPKDVRDQVQAIFKSNEDMIKKAASLEKDLKAERDLRLQREFEEKAKGYSNLGADQKEVATILKSASETSPELLTKVEAVLKAANEQISKGDLFKEYGSKASKSTGSGSAWENIEKAAEGYVAKSGEKATKEQAVTKFLQTEEGQKMYAEFKSARGGI